MEKCFQRVMALSFRGIPDFKNVYSVDGNAKGGKKLDASARKQFHLVSK